MSFFSFDGRTQYEQAFIQWLCGQAMEDESLTSCLLFIGAAMDFAAAHPSFVDCIILSKDATDLLNSRRALWQRNAPLSKMQHMGVA